MTSHNAQRIRWVTFLHMLLIGLLTTGATMASSYGDDVKILRLACAHTTPSEVNRIMRLELDSSASVGGVTSRETLLRISCVRNEIVLAAKDTKTGRLSTRRLQLPDDSLAGKERVIALAAAELILSSWEQIGESNKEASNSSTNIVDITDMETTDPQSIDGGDGPRSLSDVATSSPQQNKTPSQPDVRAPKKKKLRSRKTKVPRQLPPQEENPNGKKKTGRTTFRVSLREVGFQISATGQLYPSGRLWLWGGELAGVFVWNDAFEMQLSGSAAGGRANRGSGTASLLSTGGALLLGYRSALFSSRVHGAALLGFRLGYGRLAGRPKSPGTEGHVLSGLLGGPLVRLSLGFSANPRIGLSLEMGYAAPGIEGEVDGESDVNTSEWWGMLSVDLRFIHRLRGNDSPQ